MCCYSFYSPKKVEMGLRVGGCAREGGGDEAESLGHVALVQVVHVLHVAEAVARVHHQVAPVRVPRPPQQSTAPTAPRGVLYV